MTPQTISDQTWAGIRTEFTLPTLAQVHRRLSELMEDPEPVMRQLVRVFLSGLPENRWLQILASWDPRRPKRNSQQGSGPCSLGLLG
ncbi:hypothetical protein C9424_20715 [Arthrobacter sp. H-02-3]|nr:hypothetical protein C9424_20715 [Arthrobacter sp. H-02-3]